MGNNEVCWRNGSCSNEYHCVFHMEGCVLLSYGFQLHRHYKRSFIHWIALQAVQKAIPAAVWQYTELKIAN